MTSTISRTEIDVRMLEVRTLLSFIKTQESTATPPVDSDDVKIIRGLFYVHLYGAFEKSVNEVVIHALREIASMNIKHGHAALDFLPVSLAQTFQSLQSPTSDAKWGQRVKFVQSMQSLDVCKIKDDIFADQLQNVSPTRLIEILNYLCITQHEFVQTDLLAVSEVVEKRNQVAHGRTNPLRVGSSVKSSELEGRLQSVLSVMDQLILCVDNGLAAMKFVKNEFHAEYAAQ
ncbi:hypothetical protein PMI16_00561 [Herbaspirillum sp. CF444]|uniref:MAE_28990/MAE_18760 family HEPN-like nuclease n=1 Tax=Herbaspirillum sp. CF444 TaxID=1144319 RepID=UPI0002727E1E|nr:MAE_28990/MAE_18760 family HEPN-like nuclease [Herbaspirillum sp. CF444]EJL93511.1 hypothetical protein PMI16_00561 [Herbaspirillum sp. CF444]